jgi:dihydroflavonol-4-reductase
MGPRNMGGRVLVTGANGHLANTLVRNLLEHGYTVRGTVRDLSDLSRTAHLHAHAEALGCPERLELVEADVLDADPWPNLLKGMDGLFHTATVFSLSGDAETIITTANLGTEHLLRGAAAAGVPRIVYTSSTAAVGSTPKGRIKTEEDWQPEEGMPYTVAKTQGERRLWRLADELNLDVRVINPSAILGGGFVRPTPSVDYFPDLLGGAWPIAPPIPMAFVHVEDVAEAHRRCFEIDEASGRFLLAPHSGLTMADLARTARRLRPSSGAPTRALPRMLMPAAVVFDWFGGLRGKERRLTRSVVRGYMRGDACYDSSKAEQVLGMTWRSFDTCVEDTVSAFEGRQS